MATLYTAKLRFSLPATGELFGLWGVVVNDGITQAVEEQSSGIAQVSQSIAAIDQTMQQNAALVEESAAAAASLKQQADSLVQSVEFFQA